MHTIQDLQQLVQVGHYQKPIPTDLHPVLSLTLLLHTSEMCVVAALLQLHDDVDKTGDIASLTPAQGLVVFCQQPPYTHEHTVASMPTHTYTTLYTYENVFKYFHCLFGITSFSFNNRPSVLTIIFTAHHLVRAQSPYKEDTLIHHTNTHTTNTCITGDGLVQ